MSTTEPPAPVWPNGAVVAYALPLAGPEHRPRVLLECVICLLADPDRCAGHLAAACTEAEAVRLMRNHLAQQHDILPTGQEPLKP